MVNGHGRMLIAAPYLGEFGWELLNWQGRVRWEAVHGGYDRVAVCATPDRRPLYEAAGPALPDGRLVFCPVAQLDPPGAASEDHRIDEAGRPIAADRLRAVAEAAARSACREAGLDCGDAVILTPGYTGGLWPTTSEHQVFAELRQPAALTTDVLLVPRRRELAPERNLAESWWEDLAGELRQAGLRVEMYEPPLEEAIRRISRSRLAAGASTGGLHLASLCRCPHYVWGSGPESRWTRLGITNRQRYETIWNPLGTACRYDECGWRPAVPRVRDAICRSLETIGLAPGRSPPSWSLKPRWRLRRGLARLLDPESASAAVPWRVREFVRTHVV